jgi:hypothetical protein
MMGDVEVGAVVGGVGWDVISKEERWPRKPINRRAVGGGCGL